MANFNIRAAIRSELTEQIRRCMSEDVIYEEVEYVEVDCGGW